MPKLSLFYRIFTVEMYYRNSTKAPPAQLQLANCDKECPLDKFKRYFICVIKKYFSFDITIVRKFNFLITLFYLDGKFVIKFLPFTMI